MSIKYFKILFPFLFSADLTRSEIDGEFKLVIKSNSHFMKKPIVKRIVKTVVVIGLGALIGKYATPEQIQALASAIFGY